MCQTSAIEEKGYVLHYTSQCPFNAKYVPILEQTAKENAIPFRAIHIESRDEAQNAPTPITNYALFHDGQYVTNEQMNDKKFLKRYLHKLNSIIKELENFMNNSWNIFLLLFLIDFILNNFNKALFSSKQLIFFHMIK